MTNAQRVFDLTMALMDEMSESGQTDTADTKEYKNRTLNILNVLRGELYPYSDTYAEAEEAGKRPIAAVIEDFESAIVLDDYICQSVLPYGLAAHLLLDENPSAASFFQQKYEELKAGLARGIPQSSVDIEDVYGGYYPHNDFGWW
ncbi:MAG: hypothetical protein V8T45_04105 [Oscillospiraceae bacterium]